MSLTEQPSTSPRIAFQITAATRAIQASTHQIHETAPLIAQLKAKSKP